MADDQGFDWSGLLQSATPFAAALIPAAVGALAGGRGAAGVGAATGFAEGMRGQVGAQQEYEKQRAQVQEANQRAAIEQQAQQIRLQEFQQRQAFQAIEAQHIQNEMEKAASEKKKLDSQIEQFQLTRQKRQQFADSYLSGAEKAAFEAMKDTDQDKFMESWRDRQLRNTMLPGLGQTAINLGLPPAAAQAAVNAKEYDKLFDFVTHITTERQKAQISADKPEKTHYQATPYEFTDEASGKTIPLVLDPRNGKMVPVQLPPGGTVVGKPKPPPPANVVQTTLDKMYQADTGKKPGAFGGEEARKEWEMSPYGELASQRANNEITGPAYEQAKAALRKADAQGTANAKKDYLAQTPGKGQAKPTEEGFQKFIQTPAGKDYLEGHKALTRAGQAPPAGKPLDEATARKYYEQAGKDPAKAAAAARADGYRVEE